jgi:hypothetical protein
VGFLERKRPLCLTCDSILVSMAEKLGELVSSASHEDWGSASKLLKDVERRLDDLRAVDCITDYERAEGRSLLDDLRSAVEDRSSLAVSHVASELEGWIARRAYLSAKERRCRL